MKSKAENNEARNAMLSAIRKHLAASAPFDALHKESHAKHEDVKPTPAHTQSASLIEDFRQTLESVKGQCIVVQDEAEAAEAIRGIIEKTSTKRIAVSDSMFVKSVLKHLKTNAAIFEETDKSALFGYDMGITAAQWAVAETGTLVIDSNQERNRLSSLVPPIHIAVIKAEDIHETLGDILKSISEQKHELSRAITFITGPSRTSDIELTLAIGVHGPAELYVIICQFGSK